MKSEETAIDQSVYFERLKTSCIVKSVVRLMLAKIDNGKVDKAEVDKGMDYN